MKFYDGNRPRGDALPLSLVSRSSRIWDCILMCALYKKNRAEARSSPFCDTYNRANRDLKLILNLTAERSITMWRAKSSRRHPLILGYI